MSFDNRILRLNGKSTQTNYLCHALQCAVMQSCWSNDLDKNKMAQAYEISDVYGVIFYRYHYEKMVNVKKKNLSLDDMYNIVLNYLTDYVHEEKIDYAKAFDLYSTKDDQDQVNWLQPYNDYDVSNDPGWLIYTNNWGHVKGKDAFAVIQSSAWLGK